MVPNSRREEGGINADGKSSESTECSAEEVLPSSPGSGDRVESISESMDESVAQPVNE